MAVFLDPFTGGRVLTWSDVVDSHTVVSNEIRATTAATQSFARAQHDCGSVDHRVSCRIRTFNAAASGASNNIMVGARYQSGADTGYFVHARKNTSGQGRLEIFRRVAGVFTNLFIGTDGAVTWSAGDTVEIEVSGTGATVTVVAKKNGTLLQSVSDTDAARITTGERGGLEMRYNTTQSDVSADNWQISPLAASTGTTLGIRNTRFTINGTPTFLLGVSYFDARSWTIGDLDDFQTKGYTLLRLAIDWPQGDGTCFDASGNLLAATTLKNLANACADRGIALDVSIFGWGAITPTAGANRITAIENVATALAAHPNVMYDLDNEHNLQTGGDPGHTLLNTWRNSLRAIDSGAIVFSSTYEEFMVGETTPNATQTQAIEDHVQDVSDEDVLAPHLTRHATDAGVPAANVDNRVAALRAKLDAISESLPIYLQEEQRIGQAGFDDPTQAEFETWLTNAQLAGAAGAAAFIFHTDAGFDMRTQDFFARLVAPEPATVDALPGLVLPIAIPRVAVIGGGVGVGVIG